MKYKKAFTLIELLVVIAIIGILATISVLALSNARAKSRDAKRAGDIKQIQTALELFFNDKNRYPTIEEWNTGKIYSTSTDATSTYMQVIPTAPTPADGICTTDKNTITYAPTADLGSYNISFCLGNTTGTLASGPKCLTPAGILDVDCSTGPVEVAACSVSTVGGNDCSYGGEDYPTVVIGTQTWMAKNLNIGNMVLGSVSQSDNAAIEKYCYNDDVSACNIYGGLYQWDETMQYSVVEGAQGICPSGWHIPTDTELNTLDQYLWDPSISPYTCNANRVTAFDCANAGTKLKIGGSSEFNALMAGLHDTGVSFSLQGSYALFWASSINGSSSFYRYLNSTDPTTGRNYNSRAYGFSVRCLQD